MIFIRITSKCVEIRGPKITRQGALHEENHLQSTRTEFPKVIQVGGRPPPGDAGITIRPRTPSPWSDGIDVIRSLPSEEGWIGSWPGVGLYEGNAKIPAYQTTTLHITTHRLIIVPDRSTPSTSATTKAVQIHLFNVRQTEFYAGFMRSSAKITITLGRPPSDGSVPTNEGASLDGENESRDWTCGVCGFVNPLAEHEISPRASTKCGLCGVGYDSIRSRTGSIQASRSNTPGPASPTAPPPSPLLTGQSIACPACTFLNHPYLSTCEICGTYLPGRRRTISKPDFRESPSGSVGKTDIIRFSFRAGGDKEAYRRLKNVLSDKGWERKDVLSRQAVQASADSENNLVNGTSTPRGVAGIDGILQSINLDAKAQTTHLNTAFQDLEILMVRAGEMVKLAQSLNAKLSSSQTQQNDEETTLIRSSLVQLGLAGPALTKDMVKGEKGYLEGLAGELGRLLVGEGGGRGLMVEEGGRGVIGLDEVWGLWMRARGVALLSPSTLMSILPYLPQKTNPPIDLLTLPSTLQVLHTPQFSPPNILSRTLSRLIPDSTARLEPSMNIMEFSSYEGLPIGLAKEMMESIERVERVEGVGNEVLGLVRDDNSEGGSRWYRDIISAWNIQDMGQAV